MTVEAPTPRRRLRWVLWVLLALVAALAAIILLGGFNDVPVEKLPVAELGSTQVGNELTTTITGVHLSEKAPVTGYDLEEGKVDLVVEATLTNTTNSSSLFGFDAVRVLLDGVIDPDRDPPYSLIELRSGGGLSFLQPGLPTKVAYVWHVDSSKVAAGDKIIVGVFQRHPVADDPLFSDAQSAAAPVVRIITTIGDR